MRYNTDIIPVLSPPSIRIYFLKLFSLYIIHYITYDIFYDICKDICVPGALALHVYRTLNTEHSAPYKPVVLTMMALLTDSQVPHRTKRDTNNVSGGFHLSPGFTKPHNYKFTIISLNYHYNTRMYFPYECSIPIFE